MKKLNASSDKRKKETNYLPSETLWRATQLIIHKEKQTPSIDAEPPPQMMLGLAIGILRRQRHIPRLQLAQRIGCPLEEVVALETGLLSRSEYLKYLPLILNEIGLPENFLQPYLAKIKFA